MNKTNLINMLLAGLFVLAGAAGFTACSDSDDDKGQTPEVPTEDQHQKPVTAYDDLAYFQSSIVRVDSLGRFVERNYGEPLYKNDTTHVYVGVENLAEARKMFDGWLASDVKVTAITPSTTDVTATLTDKEGKPQGEVYFKASTDGATIADVTTTAPVRHFSKVSFILNSAWPHNVQEGKFVKGSIFPMRICFGEESFAGGDVIYKTINMVCVRSQAKGVTPMFAGIPKEKIRSTSVAHAFTSGTEYITDISESDLAHQKDAEDICDLLRADWDLFVGLFNQAGEGPLTTTDYYWIHEGGTGFMHGYQSAMNLSTKETSDFDITWSGSEFYGLYVKKSGFYIKYDPVQYVERSWDNETKTVKEEEKTLEEYYWLTGNSDDFMENEGQWYAVTEDVSFNVFNVTGTGNHLVICDGAKLKLKHLNLPEGAELTIHGGPKGTGILEVDNREPAEHDDIDYDDAAGIGGLQDKTMGTLIVQGANITAYGYARAAAIGGGDAGHGGTFIMYGGDVTAYGGEDAAAIGGGEDGRGANVTIYGGKIKASARLVSASVGAAIGGGQDAGGGTFTMYGGDVYAEGGVNAAGIGGGEDGESGNITVYGGKIVAYGGDYGAGIGSGMDASCNTLCFYGGDVEAHSGLDAAAIGTGYETKTGPNIYSGHIYFYGGKVYAVSDKGHGVAIGASERATCGWIYIYGGHVIAHGNQCGPWSGAFGAFHEDHRENDWKTCREEYFGCKRITVGKCMRMETYSWNVGYTEYVTIDSNWYDYLHGRPHVAFEDCNHENGKYTVANCPWCHSFDMVLQ